MSQNKYKQWYICVYDARARPIAHNSKRLSRCGYKLDCYMAIFLVMANRDTSIEGDIRTPSGKIYPPYATTARLLIRSRFWHRN